MFLDSQKIQDAITESQEDFLVGGLYKGANGTVVTNGDVIPNVSPAITHLRINVNGVPTTVEMHPYVTGTVSNLTDHTATVGGTEVSFVPTNIQPKEITLSSLIGLSNASDDTEEVQRAMVLAHVMDFTLVVDTSYVINPLRTTIDENGLTVHVHGLLTRPYLRMKWIVGSGIFTCVANDQNRYCILLVNHEGVELDFAKIIGDRDNHITTPKPTAYDGYDGEWGYGIRFDSGARKVRVRNPDVTKCWGDSYIIVSDQDDFGVIENMYGADSRRQGLSVIRGKGIKLKGFTHFERINGTFPMSGMDIEPDLNSEVIDIEITGVIKVNDCVGYALENFFEKQDATSEPHNIRFNCKVDLDNWMRIRSPKNIGVKNNIHFDEVHCRLMLFDTMNNGDNITVNKLFCSEPVNFRLTTDNEATLGFGNIHIKQMIPSFTSGNAWTIENSSLLGDVAFDKVPVRIDEFIFDYGVDIGSPTPSSRHAFPISVGKIKSSQTIAGSSSNLNLASFTPLSLFMDRSITTTFTVDANSIQLGTHKVISSNESLTGFLCGAGVTINGSTDTMKLTPPYKATLYTEDGTNFTITPVYSRGVEYVTV